MLPEDRADNAIAIGFRSHDQVQTARMQIVNVANGWARARDQLEAEYIPSLQCNENLHLVIVIDFDEQFVTRREDFDARVPAQLKNRVFVIGARKTPEVLKKAIKSSFGNLSFEEIGKKLAEDCYKRTSTIWSHSELQHNAPDLRRLFDVVRDILFEES
ncbi:MAG: hypothetical protein QM754_11515 [Tepidisphaeraceae bacterium]